jgi:hypothetical protein
MEVKKKVSCLSAVAAWGYRHCVLLSAPGGSEREEVDAGEETDTMRRCTKTDYL